MFVNVYGEDSFECHLLLGFRQILEPDDFDGLLQETGCQTNFHQSLLMYFLHTKYFSQI